MAHFYRTYNSSFPKSVYKMNDMIQYLLILRLIIRDSVYSSELRKAMKAVHVYFTVIEILSIYHKSSAFIPISILSFTANDSYINQVIS